MIDTSRGTDLDLLRLARDTLPAPLNAGILMGDGGFCVLGWMLLSAGFHPITLYANTLGVVEPVGGPAIDVVARVYGLARATSCRSPRSTNARPAPTDGCGRARLDELIGRSAAGLDGGELVVRALGARRDPPVRSRRGPHQPHLVGARRRSYHRRRPARGRRGARRRRVGARDR